MANNQILDSLVLFSAQKPTVCRYAYVDAANYNRAMYRLRKQMDDINELVALIRRDDTFRLRSPSGHLTIAPDNVVVSLPETYRFDVIRYLTRSIYIHLGNNREAYHAYAKANFSLGLYLRITRAGCSHD
jgi:hypothetical protein